MRFDDATQDDAEALTALHAAAAADLTARFGEGPWSRSTVVRRVETDLRFVRIRVGREKGRIVSALQLQTKKPWAIDVSYFTTVKRAIYLTGMVVAVGRQRAGMGRAALEDAHAIVRGWPADAVRLDAYDAAAGAGEFYARCGYRERGRVRYRGTPLAYYELLLS